VLAGVLAHLLLAEKQIWKGTTMKTQRTPRRERVHAIFVAGLMVLFPMAVDAADSDFATSPAPIDPTSTTQLEAHPAIATPNLSQQQFVGQDLNQSRFDGYTLHQANFKGAFLVDSSFRRADLNGANLSGANLMGADLRDACLEQANLQGAILTNARMTHTRLAGATYNNNTRFPFGFVPNKHGMVLLQ